MAAGLMPSEPVQNLVCPMCGHTMSIVRNRAGKTQSQQAHIRVRRMRAYRERCRQKTLVYSQRMMSTRQRGIHNISNKDRAVITVAIAKTSTFTPTRKSRHRGHTAEASELRTVPGRAINRKPSPATGKSFPTGDQGEKTPFTGTTA
jgi:hypothetical protein